MRRFKLMRLQDGVSVAVAEGVLFSDETVVIRWLTAYQSTAVYARLDDLRGHNSDEVWWMDEDPAWAEPEPGKIVPFRLRPATLT